MNYDVFFTGFAIALIAVMLVLAIRLRIKATLQSWGYDLTRETHNRLRDINLKLDSIQHQQERLLSGLERLERTTSTQTGTFNDLRSRLSKLETTV